MAVTETVNDPAVLVVPLTTPLLLLMDSPPGRPEADQVYLPLPPVADSARLTESPTLLPCGPGLFTETPPGGGGGPPLALSYDGGASFGPVPQFDAVEPRV